MYTKSGGNMATASLPISFIGRGERLLLKITGCRHNHWSRLFHLPDMADVYKSNRPYDNHQICLDCGAMRLYDFRTMTPGPLFRVAFRKGNYGGIA